MNTPPENFGVIDLEAALLQHWKLAAASLEYLPVGFGSHHWVAVDDRGARRFVTVDDLTKTQRGADEDTAFESLRCAFESARRLRDRGNLSFVLAPIATTDGRSVVRSGARFSVAVFPWIDAAPSAGVEYETEAERTEVVSLLHQLHGCTGVVADLAAREDFVLPHRDALTHALAELDSPWGTGPFGEPARHALAEHAENVRRLLRAYDALAADAICDQTEWVVTHGEPHAANVMRTRDGLALIDWDTTLIGPPERDLWMLDEDATTRFTRAAGTPLDADVLVLYRLWWDLAEIAVYVSEFRKPHTVIADTSKAWEGLTHYLQIEERWRALL